MRDTRSDYLTPYSDVVLVTGASGGVGLAAVELAAKIFKCEVGMTTYSQFEYDSLMMSTSVTWL